jgi:hypothetical protein
MPGSAILADDGSAVGRFPRWALEFDHVALRILHVDGRAFTFCSIPGLDIPGFDSFASKVLNNLIRVEWVDPHTKMIEIPAFRTGSGASEFPYRAINRNQIDQRIPSTNLIEADVFLDLFHGTSKNLDIEIHHRLEIHHAKDEMVDMFYLKH